MTKQLLNLLFNTACQAGKFEIIDIIFNSMAYLHILQCEKKCNRTLLKAWVRARK